MTSFSTMPAAIDALVLELLPEVPALRRVQVVDGSPTEDVADDVVAIGLAPDDIDIDAEVADVDIDAGHGEMFEIMCLARSWAGGGVLKPRRDRAFEIVTAIHDMLKANPQLTLADGTNTVMRARISRWKYLPILADRPATVVTLVFWIMVDAHPGRL